MRIAIISDIHSNLEALTKAMEIIDQQSIDEIICLGDIVGYGANPNECIELVRQRCGVTIKGNHEDAVLDVTVADDFTDNARAAILWTRKQITEENLAYIRSLSIDHRKNDMLLVHSSPCEPQEWNYIFDEDTAARSFRCFSEPLCFIGHTHMPMMFSPNGHASAITNDERYLINVGSIGQPRDRNTDLSFGIFDSRAWTYDNIRSSYDIATAASKILNTTLPPKLGQRLFMGV
ncbi:MAG: metallophosphoesterase family protein [Bacteroidota bacterium]|jgi:predicted phosphodiesterase